MTRDANKPRRKPAPGRAARVRAAARPRARADASPIQKLILTLGRTIVGFLPCSRSIRAANDPES
jgi:hypothetical protein